MRDVQGVSWVAKEKLWTLGDPIPRDHIDKIDPKNYVCNKVTERPPSPPMPAWANNKTPIPRRPNYKPLTIIMRGEKYTWDKASNDWKKEEPQCPPSATH